MSGSKRANRWARQEPCRLVILSAAYTLACERRRGVEGPLPWHGAFLLRNWSSSEIKIVLVIEVLRLRGKFTRRTFHSTQDDKGRLSPRDRCLTLLHHSRGSYILNT